MNKEVFKIGMSSAASWAWGTSLIMGQQIAQEKGIVAWIIWAVCNTLSVALFGWLYNHKAIQKEICNRRETKVIALIIQLFCLIVQLNFINQQFHAITGNPTESYIITVGIGIFFTLIVFKKGLPTSIFTDVIQWMVAIGGIVAVIITGIVMKVPMQTFAETTSDGLLWGAWSGLILFSGLIGDVQHWQRAEADTTHKGYYFGSFLFGLYMCLVLGMAVFEFNTTMNVILLVAVLCVTTSTIDSIAVALHELGNKYIGTGIALLICIGWGLFVEMGMVELWSSFGVIRFAFAVAILLFPFCLKGNTKLVYVIGIIAYAIIVTFGVLGQIKINSYAGVISFAVATMIIAYVMGKANGNSKQRKRCL